MAWFRQIIVSNSILNSFIAIKKYALIFLVRHKQNKHTNTKKNKKRCQFVLFIQIIIFYALEESVSFFLLLLILCVCVCYFLNSKHILISDFSLSKNISIRPTIETLFVQSDSVVCFWHVVAVDVDLLTCFMTLWFVCLIIINKMDYPIMAWCFVSKHFRFLLSMLLSFFLCSVFIFLYFASFQLKFLATVRRFLLINALRCSIPSCEAKNTNITNYFFCIFSPFGMHVDLLTFQRAHTQTHKMNTFKLGMDMKKQHKIKIKMDMPNCRGRTLDNRNWRE